MAISQVAAKFTADISQLQASMVKAQASVQAAGAAIEKSGNDMGKSFEKAGTSFEKAGRKIQDQGFAVGAALGTAGTVIGAALGFSIKKAADFEAEIDKVGAIAGASSSDMQRLRQAALDLGASTSKSASEVAQGMQQMAAAGYSTNQIIAAMPGVIAAAEASGEDMATVTDVVTAALNGFGLKASEASHVADVLAQSANQSAADINDLGYAFKYAAPVAKQLGFSLEWLSAAVGVMTDAGLKGEQAGTTLRMALARLVDPPKEAAKAIEAMGISLTTANGKIKPTPQLLNEVMTKLRGMGKEQRTAAASTIFGTEAMSGMLVLLNKSPSAFNKLVAGLEKSDGAAARTAKQMKENLKGSIEQLGGAVETLQISIGDALSPAINVIAQALTKLANWFNNLSQPMKSFLAISAAIVSILLIVGSVIALAVAGLGAMAAAFGVAIGTVAATIGIIAGVVAAIIAIGAAIVYAYNHFSGFRKFVNQTWEAIKAGFSKLVAYLQPAIKEVTSFFMEQWGIVTQWVHEILPNLKEAFSNILNGIIALVSPFAKTVMAYFKWAFPAMIITVKTTWNIIKTVISTAITIIINIINIFAGVFTGNWKQVWNAVVEITQTLWNSLVQILTALWNGLIAVLKVLWAPIGEFFSNLWNGIVETTTSIWNSIVSFFTGIWNSIVTFAQTIWNNLVSFIVGIWNSILTFASTVWNAIKTAVVTAFEWMYNHNYYFQDLVDFIVKVWGIAKQVTNQVWNAVKSFVSSVWNGIKSVASSVFNAISSVILTAWNGIKTSTLTVWNGIKSVLSSIWNGIKSVVSSVWSWISSKITSVWNSIRSATSSAWNSIKTTISNVGNSIKSTLSGLASQALQWGKNLLTMFADGIKSKVSAVITAAKDAAKAIAKILGFHSPTEEGPASDSDTWAPNFVKMFADGLRKSQPLVQKQLSAMASQMKSLSVVPINPQLNNPAIAGSYTASSSNYVPAVQSGSTIINLTGPVNMRSDNDIRKLAKELDRLKNQRLRSQGKVR
ncbi:phage tail tape measure protein [Thermoactinomyces daqus]|uniref:Phage tail tape measure protein n=1 Tax=Thermoactinomyces daqus TaxID=1329516 RepID=A0A7W1XA84_9BACL|nr:phage tail tape measure protein [Thermoactinomyces daqus]MBA4542885.1 phage tail tape measure protein [Thermoactinomyces daqus]